MALYITLDWSLLWGLGFFPNSKGLNTDYQLSAIGTELETSGKQEHFMFRVTEK